MSDGELVDALRRAHGAAAFAQAAEVRAVRELYRRHRAGNAAPGPGGVRAGEFAAAEVSMAVQISEQLAAALIDIGLALDGLPRTREAFGSGRLDLTRVQVIVDNARGLSRDLLADLEGPLVEAAVRTTPARLRQTARRWLSRLDGPGEQRRREQREDCRDIRLTAVQDGAAVVAGLLPADGAQTVAMRLREMAHGVCADDPRTMPQRRADALVALADGTDRLHCACGRGNRCTATDPDSSSLDASRPAARRPLIQIGATSRTLSGATEEPGYLMGYGPIDAELVRRIAERADIVAAADRGARPSEQTSGDTPAERRSGAQGSAGTHRRSSHAAALASIGLLDRTCRFPGCTMPGTASGSEMSGTADRGPASESAAVRRLALCPHHRLLASLTAQRKTRWQLRWLDAGHVQWTSPTGDIHTTTDEDAKYLFPQRDTEMPVIDPTPGPTSVVTVPVSALDAGYPIGGHALVHRRLAEGTPEDCTVIGESYRY
ncbi:DUF222 domain-containing protein [Nocardia spumae]|uniref:DUF222 domain-containing protein n=1 Tax=Nocardia spumae TaxID=2887190 RepID=UPI001D157921|nr:DUF222 domain-containing protein [Nocardia spumae]